MRKHIKVSVVVIFICIFVFYVHRGYYEYVNGIEYFQLTIVQPIDGKNISTTLLGRVSKKRGWTTAANSISSGFLEKCEGCTLQESFQFLNIPKKYVGIFENKSISEVYVSVDAEDPDAADVRVFLRGFEQPFSIEDCMATKSSFEGAGKAVVCVNSI